MVTLRMLWNMPKPSHNSLRHDLHASFSTNRSVFCQPQSDGDFTDGNPTTAALDWPFGKKIKSRFEGNTWKSVCESIIQQLPEKVYISFDIDGLQPELCPNTGTPVPGGLDFHETVYLLTLLAESGKQIVGFDLNEVSPGNDEWDANVGARMLYQLSCLMHYSQQT